MKYKCLLFDFDGTLAYSDDALFSTVNDTLVRHGHLPINKEIFNSYIGKKMRELYYKYANENSDIVKKMRETHVMVQKDHMHKYRLYPDVLETITKLKDNGHILGIVTTANKMKITELSKTMNFFRYFDVLITAEDVVNVKPHKEPIDKALNLLGQKASDAIMIGDTDADIEAAKSAGVDSVGVTYSTFGDRVKEYNPTYTIDHINKILKIVD